MKLKCLLAWCVANIRQGVNSIRSLLCTQGGGYSPFNPLCTPLFSGLVWCVVFSQLIYNSPFEHPNIAPEELSYIKKAI